MQSEIVHGFIILLVDVSSSVEYTLSYLTQGRYQFNVVAFTSQGPGEAANLILSILGMLIVSGYKST